MSPGFDLGPARRPRRPSLTPLIDVVFLLLVFFMLAARFGPEAGLALAPGAGDGAQWQGPPRLVRVGAQGLLLNGAPVTAEALPRALAPLMPGTDAPVVILAGAQADAQALAEVLSALGAAGYERLVLMAERDGFP